MNTTKFSVYKRLKKQNKWIILLMMGSLILFLILICSFAINVCNLGYLNLFLVLLIIFIIYFSLSTYEYSLSNYNTDLVKEGFIFFPKHLSKYEILKYLPENYVFLDYKYEIHGCSLSTFHRDVTSSQYVFESRYPVYTYICYFNKGKTLSVCPGSHRTVPFLYSNPRIITSKNVRSSILFNCDLIHAGYFDKKRDKYRKVIQYKIIHKNDLDIFKSLSGINKVTKYDCEKLYTWYDLYIRKISLFNSYIINHCFTKYLQEDQKNYLNKLFIKKNKKKFYNK